ncbi:MAG: MoaD/ThiS family protein [Candidatus Bathyarchaeota archaeon]|nr:MoaD/ThiS family protein [Candidatus Bathyarchaeota archaeon]
MAITVKFIGSLRHDSGANELALNCRGNISVIELINQIAKEVPAVARSLIDQQLEDPRPNVLILVNGREISVLDGLDTVVQEGDEVVLVPVVHGG